MPLLGVEIISTEVSRINGSMAMCLSQLGETSFPLLRITREFGVKRQIFYLASVMQVSG